MKIANFYKIHRYLGLAVAISLVWLSATGIFLNHTEDLKLDEKHIDNALLSQLYGLSTPELGNSFQFDKDWVIQYGEAFHFNNQVLMEQSKPIVAALKNDNMYVVATQNKAHLFTLQGELIDQLKTPEALQQMAWLDQKLTIQTTKNTYQANDDITEWQLFDSKNKTINWSKETQLPVEQQKTLEAKYRGQGPTLEQVILDTHSGRLFGMVGVYFADLIAVLTIILTLLGVYLWSRRLKRGSRVRK